MNTQSKTPKGVCFLGAGASAWAGVPTFSNFRKKAEDVYNNLPDGSTEKNIFRDVLNNWRTGNIEDYYRSFEMRKKFKPSPVDRSNSDIITAEDIVTVICNTIQKSAIKTKPKWYYELLIFILQDEGFNSIITTNWDILLESGREHYLKECLINYEGISAYDRELPIKGDYHILKLHGSLNWGFCEKCKEAYYTDKKKCDILISSEGLVCKKCQNKLKPLVIPPTISKLSEIENPKYAPVQLVNIWKRAYEYLSTCEKIYFIGYSLPDTDTETKHFIAEALRDNPYLKEVFIISNETYTASRDNLERRYSSIVPEIAIPKFIYDGFENFCDSKYNSIMLRAKGAYFV